MTTLRQMKAKVKARTEERRAHINRITEPKHGGPSLTAGRDGSQIFVSSFRFENSQAKLDNVHRVVKKLKAQFKDELIRIDYSYFARTKYVSGIGPAGPVLLKKVDGDMRSVKLSIRLIYPDY